MPQESEDTLLGRVIGRRYQLLDRIGRGGSSAIYRAVQRPLGRHVAVKVLRDDLDVVHAHELGRRFLSEARLACRLQHTNVVTYLDAGVTKSGLRFVVMELLEGRTLAEAIRGTHASPAWTAHVCAGLARGLQHAHVQGLAHRDIKPSNVFLVPDDDGVERPVLVDFGLVRDVQADDDRTDPGMFLGTPSYASPEHVRGTGDAGAPSDIYALGCVMYRMLTGVVPFKDADGVATALMHVHAPFPVMADRSPGVDVPEVLETWVRRCMAKDHSARPSAAELATALEAFEPEAMATIDAPLAVVAAPASDTRLRVLGGGLAVLLALALAGVAMLVLPGAPAPEPSGGAEAMGVESADVEPAEPAVVAPEAAPVAAPDPAPAVEPEPEPAVVVAVAAKPPAPAAKPAAPAPDPRPASTAPVKVDGLTFTAAHAKKLVDLVNGASPMQLADAGVYEDGVRALMSRRPYADLAELGAVRGIGAKTLRALAAATSDNPDAWREKVDVALADDGRVDVEGVLFDPAHAVRTLAFVNTADRAALTAVGVYDRGVDVIVDRRPFQNLAELAAAPLIGQKTLEKLRDGTM